MQSTIYSQFGSRLDNLSHPIFEQAGIKVQIKRDDLIHPIISGNKWRKLKYNLQYAKQQGCKGIVSFGGAYSNHIHALAYACMQQGLSAVGIIRGEQHYQDNFTLTMARSWGMQLNFVSRNEYQLRYDVDYLAKLQQRYSDHLLVPEGGSNNLALKGVGEVISELNNQTEFDHLLVPVGSSGTLAGLIAADQGLHQITGIAVLKQADYLKAEIKSLISSQQANDETYFNWQLLTQYHGGGYGKFSPAAVTKLIEFNNSCNITLEPIYSGKMLLAFLELIEQGYFKPGERIVLLHTGGLQGLGGLLERGRLSAKDWPDLDSLFNEHK